MNELFDDNRAELDFSAMLSAAIRAKRTKDAEAFDNVEQTPAGERLTWHVTPEQIARINAGDRAALDAFYFNNLQRLTFSARRFLRHNCYVKSVASDEDLIQQVYCDLRTGLLRLRPYDHAISSAVFHSFRYAAVGGIDEIYVHERKERKKQCRKQAN